ncbi:hypothetical protein [Massilia phosphatilytica]
MARRYSGRASSSKGSQPGVPVSRMATAVMRRPSARAASSAASFG